MGKQTKYTKSSRGKDCQLRIPGICNGNNETTVPCHLNELQFRVGHKSLDIHIADGCSDCHDAIDGRSRTNYSASELKQMHLEGVIRTQIRMYRDGTIKV